MVRPLWFSIYFIIIIVVTVLYLVVALGIANVCVVCTGTCLFPLQVLTSS